MNNIQGSFPLSFCLCSGKARLMEATTFQSTASNLKPTHWLRLLLLLSTPTVGNMPGNNPEEQGCLSGDAERIAPGSERGLPFMLFNFVPAVCYCFAYCVCRGLKLSFVLLDSPEIVMGDEPFLSLHFRRKTVKLRWWNSPP